MANPLKAYLKSIHTASMSESQKKAALGALNKSLNTNFESNKMFEEIHKSLLGMFSDYDIFGDKMLVLTSMIQANKWIAVSQQIESFIFNEDYPKAHGETPVRRGLIQIYLYYFASRYLNRPEYTFKYIQSSFLNLKNLNRLQKDREMVFSELLVRMKSNYGVNIYSHPAEGTFIQREKFMKELVMRLQENPYLMLIGPQGMGKTVTLRLIEDFMGSKYHIRTYQFTSRDQLSHPDYFVEQMSSFFNIEALALDNINSCLFLLDDLHLLPPSLHQVIRQRVLPEVLKIYNQRNIKFSIIAASAFPIEIMMGSQFISPRFLTYNLVELEKAEVEELWNKSSVKATHFPEEIYKVTRGYPALVNQMMTSGVNFDHSQWFRTIFNTVNWDEPITELMKALCTFRYIGPFFINDLAKFINDPYLLQEVWHIPETILDSAQAHLLWEKLVYRNAFIQRVRNQDIEFPLNKNFIISRVIRQLAENAVRSDRPAVFDLRHKLASDYYYSQISNPLIPGSKKPLLTIEYFYHLAKQGLSSRHIFSIKRLSEVAISPDRPSDIKHYTINFLKHFTEDSELKEVMGVALFNDITPSTLREDTE